MVFILIIIFYKEDVTDLSLQYNHNKLCYKVVYQI